MPNMTPAEIDALLVGSVYENAAHKPLNPYGIPGTLDRGAHLDYGRSNNEEAWVRDTIICCQNSKLNAALTIQLTALVREMVEAAAVYFSPIPQQGDDQFERLQMALKKAKRLLGE